MTGLFTYFCSKCYDDLCLKFKAFLDRELAHFISSGKLQARIDKVAGIVETNRTDARNAQYLDVIKRGDELLYRVGKLSRAVSK